MKTLQELQVGDIFTDIPEEHRSILIFERIFMIILPNGYILFCGDIGNGWFEVLEINSKYKQ